MQTILNLVLYPVILVMAGIYLSVSPLIFAALNGGLMNNINDGDQIAEEKQRVALLVVDFQRNV